MSILLVAEHNDAALNPVTLNVLAAAQAIGGDITVLVAGEGCGAAAEAAAALPGVSKVLSADAAIYGKQLAENVAPLIAEAAAGHSHVLSAHSTNGKNTMMGYGDKLSPEERWAVVAYVRALQLSQNCPPDLVPAAVKAQIK